MKDALSQARLSGDPEKDLNELLDLYLDFVARHRNLWAVLFDYRPAADRPVPGWYQAKVAGLLSLIEDALSPLFPPEQEERCAGAARVLWAGLHGVCALSETGKLEVVTDRTVRDMADMLVGCFIAGLRQEAA